MPSARFSLKQSAEKQRFRRALDAWADTRWTEKTEQYCDYRLDGSHPEGWLRAKQFSNGTLYLEASSDTLLGRMTALLQPGSPNGGQVGLFPTANGAGGPSASASTSAPVPAPVSGLLNVAGAYIGTDESGKGDYFGPLVIAGVHVTEETAQALLALGVMDSKKLTDARIEAVYRALIGVVGEKALSVVEMSPTKYNELYARFKAGGKNLNHLLAWGHATVIENLLTRFPDCPQAIADQFGHERYILSQLKEKGKGITLHQTHRAEANVGVAAASIVARYRFVTKLRQLSDQFEMPLPLGAGPGVKTAARRLLERHGRESLGAVAKLHFKTTGEL